MISFFKKKQSGSQRKNFLKVDIHSHLIPGIDDGCKNIEESLLSIRMLAEYGYKKIVITPHIISDYYPNTPQTILPGLEILKKKVEEEGLDILLEAAAEYYLDESFLSSIEKNEKLLSFGKNYVLLELGFYNEPIHLSSAVFGLLGNGYTPVLAHPERYLYLHNQFEKIREWVDKGLLLQINLLSLVGHYSHTAQQFCEQLIDEKLVSFAGSDAHNPKHTDMLKNVYSSKYFVKLAENNLLNDSLI